MFGSSGGGQGVLFCFVQYRFGADTDGVAFDFYGVDWLLKLGLTSHFARLQTAHPNPKKNGKDFRQPKAAMQSRRDLTPSQLARLRKNEPPAADARGSKGRSLSIETELANG